MATTEQEMATLIEEHEDQIKNNLITSTNINICFHAVGIIAGVLLTVLIQPIAFGVIILVYMTATSIDNIAMAVASRRQQHMHQIPRPGVFMLQYYFGCSIFGLPYVIFSHIKLKKLIAETK